MINFQDRLRISLLMTLTGKTPGRTRRLLNRRELDSETKRFAAHVANPEMRQTGIKKEKTKTGRQAEIIKKINQEHKSPREEGHRINTWGVKAEGEGLYKGRKRSHLRSRECS